MPLGSTARASRLENLREKADEHNIAVLVTRQ